MIDRGRQLSRIFLQIFCELRARLQCEVSKRAVVGPRDEEDQDVAQRYVWYGGEMFPPHRGQYLSEGLYSCV